MNKSFKQTLASDHAEQSRRKMKCRQLTSGKNAFYMF